MFKPRYAPELEELIHQRDGSIDETPHLIQMTKANFAQDYRRKQEEFSRERSQTVKEEREPRYQQSRHRVGKRVRYPENTSFAGAFANLKKEFRNIYDEVKKELEK